MADQVFRVDAGEFFFADRERYDRDVRCLDAGVGQLLVEGHIGVAVDRRDHRRLLAGRGEALDRGNFGLPVGVAERGIIDLDVLGRDAFRLQKSLEDLVGSARVDVVGAFQHPTFAAPPSSPIRYSTAGIACWFGAAPV